MSYKHFSIEERGLIDVYLRNGVSISEIARKLNRNKSSVSREIKRNSDFRGQYIALYAKSYTNTRRKNCKWNVETNEKLIEYIEDKILETWSPEQISNRLKFDFPNDNTMQISFKKIYSLIYTHKIPGITKKNLRHKGKKRHYGVYGKKVLIPNKTSITERPESINNREKIGDWEVDTVRSSQATRYCLATYADRNSRYYIAVVMKNGKAISFRNASLGTFKKKARKKINSFTCDNGSEFAEHEKIAESLEISVYFAKPHSPGDRPTNENENGLLREFYPKGFNFNTITQNELDDKVGLINKRPRKCLGWRTAEEVFFEQKS